MRVGSTASIASLGSRMLDFLVVSMSRSLWTSSISISLQGYGLHRSHALQERFVDARIAFHMSYKLEAIKDAFDLTEIATW